MTLAIVHPDGRFVFKGEPIRCALGQAGIVLHKQEGDHGTPCGTLPLRRVLYRADRVAAPRCVVRVEPIAPNDGWCDDIYSDAYNTQVVLPINASHEHLWRDDELYDVICVLGWNDAPIKRGFGSAIFLHVASRDFAPTEGCIALPRPTLLRVLADGLSGLTVLPP